MINRPKPYISPRLLLGVVVLFLILSFIPTSAGPLLEVLIQKAGIGAVQSSASEYLGKQREQALEGFLVLSALKISPPACPTNALKSIRLGSLVPRS